MSDWGMGDVVALQLEGTDQWREARVVPRDVAVPGISDALDLGQGSLADRVALLSALDDLKREGLVAERKKQIRGMKGRRNAYFLTERGREYVERLRDDLADETVVVRDGADEEEIPVAEAGRYLPEPAIPRALSRTTDEGVLYLDESVGESFVNREAERALLESTLESVRDDESHVVLVAGEAGVGKTTLVTDEFADVAREAGFEVAVGNCRRDSGEPYAPIRTALGNVAGDEADPFDREAVDPEDARGFAAERTALFEGVVASLERSTDRPLLVVIEDLHVADESTVALFRHLSNRVDGPVMLVGTFRPDDPVADHPLSAWLDEWEAADRHLRIDLEPLDRSETRRLIQWVLDHRSIPSSFVDLVYDRTGGNPLFVKESVARMVEEGAVDVEHDVFPDDPSDVPLISRVEETVERRLSVLDGATREVVDVAGVAGETIPFSVLARAVEMDEPELRERVDVLVDSHVFEWTDDDQVRFASGLVRETVVEDLDADRRRSIHAKLAGAVLAADEGDRDYHATVAHHYHRAGEYEAAVEHYLEAADRAQSVYAHEVALENYQRALDLRQGTLGYPEDDDAVVEVLQDIADVNYLLGEYDEADRYYQYVADRLEDPERLRRVYRIRSDMAASRGDHETELELAREGLRRCGIDDTLETCLLFGREGAGHQNLGEFDEAEERYRQCLGLARRIDEPEGKAAAYLDFGALDIQRNEIDDETVSMLEDAVAAAERADGDRALARALNNLALCQVELGRIDEAEATYHRCLAVQEAIGDRVALCSSLRNLASIQEERGDRETALDTYERALETAKTVRNHNELAHVTLAIGGVYQSRGDLDLAVEYVERSVEHAARLDGADRRAYTLSYMADLYLDRGDVAAAADVAADLADVVDEVRDAYHRSLASAVLGDVAYQSGDLDAARRRYEAGLDALDPHAWMPTVVYNAGGLVRVAVDRGRPHLAREYADRAGECARAANDEWVSAAASVYDGVARRMNEEFDAAATALTDALETFRRERSRSVVGEVEALVELAALEVDRGRDDEAGAYLDEARSLAADHGVGRFDDRIRSLASDLADGTATDGDRRPVETRSADR